MSNPQFHIAENDTLPTLDVVLLQSVSGTPADLTGALSAQFTLYDVGGAARFTRTATIVSASDGEVSYAWQSGDTSEPGSFLGRFKVNYAGGDSISYPNDRYIKIVVSPS